MARSRKVRIVRNGWTHEVMIRRAPAALIMFRAVSPHSPTAFEQFCGDDRIDRVVSPRLSMAVRSSRSAQKTQEGDDICRYRSILFHTNTQRMLRLRKESRTASNIREEA